MYEPETLVDAPEARDETVLAPVVPTRAVGEPVEGLMVFPIWKKLGKLVAGEVCVTPGSQVAGLLTSPHPVRYDHPELTPSGEAPFVRSATPREFVEKVILS